MVTINKPGGEKVAEPKQSADAAALDALDKQEAAVQAKEEEKAEPPFRVYWQCHNRPNVAFHVVFNGVRTKLKLKGGSLLVEDPELDAAIQAQHRVKGMKRVDFNQQNANFKRRLLQAQTARPQAAQGPFTSNIGFTASRMHHEAQTHSLTSGAAGADIFNQLTGGNGVATE